MKKHFRSNRSFKDVTGIVTVNQLSYILAEPRTKLVDLVNNRDTYYHPFIDEKNGKKRPIDQPIGELKKIHYKIKDRILSQYVLSKAVQGAVLGHSPRDNAKKHLKQAVVVRLDLSDCFHSTKSKWVYSCFRTRYKYSHQVAKLLTDLCTYNGSIPVGSPLSSMLVNIVYDPLWRKIEAYCLANGNMCTIWVDDIIMSGPNAESLILEVKRLINHHGLRISWKKLTIQRNHKEAQEVTGCVVNERLSISKKKRRAYAKTAILAKTDKKLMEKLKGQLASLQFVNPNQGRQLIKLISKKFIK